MRSTINLFTPDPNTDFIFLNTLSKKSVTKDLVLLKGEGGFGPPNNFDYKLLLEPIIKKHFPACDFYEYVFAISECGYETIANLPRWARLYVASIYIYCNKRMQWAIDIESDYYYMILISEVDEMVTEISYWFLVFLEWLYECVPDDEGYEDYFLVLSWIYLRRLRCDVNDKIFTEVMTYLQKKRLSIRDLNALTDANRGLSDWLKIYKKLPIDNRYSSEEYGKLIA